MAFIRLKTNQPRLILNLKHAFTPHSMLGELLQNARRAGARNIQIDADDDSITVTDDGSGIADLQSLIHIAESGWDEDLQRRENAFGMGILSTLYFSERLFVHSGELAFDARTADIIAGEAIEVLAHEPRTGTQIRLYAVKTDQMAFDLRNWVQRHLVSLCEAFPVPVSFNGTEIPRPLADPSLAWRNTTVGRVLIDIGASHLDWRCFLQGLPIGDQGWPRGKHIVLLRDDMIARLPDRQRLLDEEAEKLRIQGAINIAMREVLVETKASMDIARFLANHGGACLNTGNADLLNDIPFAKLSWFRDRQALRSKYAHVCEDPDHRGVIAAAILNEAGVWDIEIDGSDDDFASIAYVGARNGLLLDEYRLHTDHWLWPIVRHIRPNDITVSTGAVLHEDKNLPLADAVDLVLTDSIRLGVVGDEVTYPVAAIRKNDVVYVMPDASNVTRFISDYEFDNRYDEAAEAADIETIRTFIAVGQSHDPAAVIDTLLSEQLRYTPQPKLANATVRLVFDGEGKLQSVTL